ncbi:hypothetical protein ACI2IY_12910 [Lysobacter enzymogenes]|uniref:hypothetical protein n=1 Tax=Lysobacter enzymogenes TaxID=69 RepID=UPI00384A6585
MSETVPGALTVLDTEIAAAREDAFKISNYQPDTADQDEYERRCNRVRDLMATRSTVTKLYAALRGLVAECLHHDGGEFEDGEWLALDRARAALDHGHVEDLYYLQDSRSYVGNCPQWWCPNGRGYTTRIDEAAKFTREQAARQQNARSSDVPWPCTLIDSLQRPTIDIQDLHKASAQSWQFAADFVADLAKDVKP